MGRDEKEFKEKLKKLPDTPGVYIMKDQHGQIIYAGKAKKLKQRIMTYFQKSSSHSNKVQRMVFNIQDFDFIMVDTELDALLLECQLIQKHHPLYNRQMNAYSNYPYVWISNTGIQVVNQATSDCYGPFRSYKQLPTIIALLSELYQLPWINHLTRLRLAKQMPAIANVTIPQRLIEINDFFQGKDGVYRARIDQRIQQLVEDKKFEQAADLSNKYSQLHSFFNQTQVLSSFIKLKQLTFAIPLQNKRIKYYQVAYGRLLATKIVSLNESYSLAAQPDQPFPLTKKSLDSTLILMNYIKKTSEIN